MAYAETIAKNKVPFEGVFSAYVLLFAAFQLIIADYMLFVLCIKEARNLVC